MNVAFQLFGHLRTFEQCAASLRRHVLDRYPDRDVFLHTWDQLDHPTTMHRGFQVEPPPVDAAVRAAVERAYAPTRMAIDRQQPEDRGELEFANGKRWPIMGIVHMQESMYRANALREAYSRETGARYDVVVAVRPDLMFHRDLDLEAYLAYSMPPEVPTDESQAMRYCAFGPMPKFVNDLRGAPATDLLFFSRPGVMTRVLGLARDLERYDIRKAIAPSRPRNLMNTYCADIGVTVALVDFIRPRDFDILRPAPAA